MAHARPPALLALDPRHVPELFPPEVLARLTGLVELGRPSAAGQAHRDGPLVAARFDDPADTAVRQSLARAEVLITGWGCPPVDATVLAAAPRLRAVVHTAGSVKSLVTEACWERGIAVSSGADTNGVPVAEFTLAAVLFAGKGVFAARERMRAERGALSPFELGSGIGNFGRRVGIIGASRIGRRVIELLRPFDLEVWLSDPYVDAAAARSLGVRPAGLDELLASCEVVSLHAPTLPETYRMLDRERLALLPDGAVLINTARGALIDTAALTDEVASGRITAVLDVTDPEPLPPDDRLLDLPGAFLTPHLAGSLGKELERLGSAAVDEVERLAAGAPFARAVRRADLARSG
ncbi:hydroxyacid dehydrogenase [Streptomyces sp. NPDC048332]|uniref:hydroxyacid dehydrogenase n=1 Tax=Streptomyces sp. NPDC048332 TaxID=3154619 RepID=UPI003439969B